jgi:tungstate ABC transporter binding protein WtpA
MATTTSLYDTGLLDYLRATFEPQDNVNLRISSQGTGKAIQLAQRGDVDILMVHDPAQEAAFMESGYGINRRCVAYNYFMIVGPSNDPAGIKGLKPEDAFKKILIEGKKGSRAVMFVSRGDGSGTHSAEQRIWKAAGYTYASDVQKSGNWYIESGKGMGETLTLASEKGAYTLTDEGTSLAFKGKLQLVPLITQGGILLNIYSTMSINPVRFPNQNVTYANDWTNFLMSEKGQAMVGSFGVDKYGKALFNPLHGDACKPYSCDCNTPATATTPLHVFHAGSLAGPFAKLKAAFEKSKPDVEVQLFSSGSVDAVNKITTQNKKGEILASADYFLIPQLMIPSNASWYINFARNEMVLTYTDQSRYAGQINPDNWYLIINRPDVTWAISDPNSDPAGYRSLMAIQLQELASGKSVLFEQLVGAYSNITTTESSGITMIHTGIPKPDNKKFIIKPTANDVVSSLKAGTIDYGWEYRSVAIQNGLKFVDLPEAVDLSSLDHAKDYAHVQVETMKGSQKILYPGTPIVYAVTVPTSAEKPDLGVAFVKLLIGPDGQKILSDDGQVPITPPMAYGTVLDDLKPLVTMG